MYQTKVYQKIKINNGISSLLNFGVSRALLWPWDKMFTDLYTRHKFIWKYKEWLVEFWRKNSTSWSLSMCKFDWNRYSIDPSENRSNDPNGITIINSSIFAWLTHVINRQTDHATHVTTGCIICHTLWCGLIIPKIPTYQYLIYLATALFLTACYYTECQQWSPPGHLSPCSPVDQDCNQQVSCCNWATN